MKRFVAITLSGLIITGFIIGISIAQDKAGNPSSDQQERREESRDVDGHREELANHAREIRAEIKSVQNQFDKAREGGNERQAQELQQFLEELHEELLHVERELQDGEREHSGGHEHAFKEMQQELRHLEEALHAAEREGNEVN